MDKVKSITVVNTTAGWAVRQRNADGKELFIVCDPANKQSYTLQQAEHAAGHLRWYLLHYGDTYAEPLPDGVREV